MCSVGACSTFEHEVGYFNCQFRKALFRHCAALILAVVGVVEVGACVLVVGLSKAIGTVVCFRVQGVRSCAALVNTKAGNGVAKKLFEGVLQTRLKQAGVSHWIAEVPRRSLAPSPEAEGMQRQRKEVEASTTCAGHTESLGDPIRQEQLLRSSALPLTGADLPWDALLAHPAVQALVVCGGDGTIHHVANTLQRHWVEQQQLQQKSPARSGAEKPIKSTAASVEREKEEAEVAGGAAQHPDETGGKKVSPLTVSSSPYQKSDQTAEAAAPAADATRRSSSASSWVRKPIVLLPAGATNNVAFQLGLDSPERAVTGLVLPRTEKVWIWELRRYGAGRPSLTDSENASLHGGGSSAAPLASSSATEGRAVAGGTDGRRANTRTGCDGDDINEKEVGRCAVVSHVLFGVLAAEQRYWQQLRREWNQFVALPQLSAATQKQTPADAAAAAAEVPTSNTDLSAYASGSFARIGSGWARGCTLLLATLVARYRRRQQQRLAVPGDLTLILDPSSSEHRAESDVVHLKGPFQLVVASAFPSQTPTCWLTPAADPRSRLLSVTLVTPEASAARLWHLVRHEGAEAEVLEEDGVQCFNRVKEVRLHLWRKEGERTSLSRRRTAKEKEKEAKDTGVEGVVDGELVQFPRGETIRLSCSPNWMNILPSSLRKPHQNPISRRRGRGRRDGLLPFPKKYNTHQTIKGVWNEQPIIKGMSKKTTTKTKNQKKRKFHFYLTC
eukprot:gene11638-8023_t